MFDWILGQKKSSFFVHRPGFRGLIIVAPVGPFWSTTFPAVTPSTTSRAGAWAKNRLSVMVVGSSHDGTNSHDVFFWFIVL